MRTKSERVININLDGTRIQVAATTKREADVIKMFREMAVENHRESPGGEVIVLLQHYYGMKRATDRQLLEKLKEEAAKEFKKNSLPGVIRGAMMAAVRQYEIDVATGGKP